ncbi:LCP family protein [Rossellomorea aquimaris]|uniref:LCP family protein n=1 Tax=Rossellomorea aquimaris TaxID=189382 RepID=UPI001CD5BFE7|nr:LCP family protein [Rossellomorea aquimaris]MCA1054515.1 LCP family protein [Rossellomorea aquimaris]
MSRKWTVIPLVLVLTFLAYIVIDEPSAPSEITSMNEESEVKSTDTVKEVGDANFLFDKNEKTTPINVLVVGSDQRNNEAERADVLMIAQYIPKQPNIKLVSIMRDTYVEIPGHGKSKINHAFAWGGNELVIQTLKKNFGIEIDQTVNLDFQDFTKVMGLIFPNGVEVDVSEGMINHWKWMKEPGRQWLKGEEILQYVRFRGDIQSDFGRVDRQQEIIMMAEKEIMDKLSSGKGITTVIGLVREGFKNVETSFSIDQVMKHGVSFMLHPIDEVETIRIPVEGSYQNVLIPGAGEVLEMDESQNLKALEEFIH